MLTRSTFYFRLHQRAHQQWKDDLVRRVFVPGASLASTLLSCDLFCAGGRYSASKKTSDCGRDGATTAKPRTRRKRVADEEAEAYLDARVGLCDDRTRPTSLSRHHPTVPYGFTRSRLFYISPSHACCVLHTRCARSLYSKFSPNTHALGAT